MSDKTPDTLTDDTLAELIQAYLKTREAAASAKISLDVEKQRLVPYEEAKKAADREHAEAKGELFDALGEPGAKFTTPAGTASLSRPRTIIVRELDMDALVAHLKERHPRMLERFTVDVERTSTPRLTVKEA